MYLLVGFDAKVHNLNWYHDSLTTLTEQNINLVAVEQNPIDLSWSDRPVPTKNKGLLLSQKYTGLSSLEKRQQKACNKVREILCSDEAFLDWVWENIIDECSTDIEEVTPNTLIAWRKLPKFGT